MPVPKLHQWPAEMPASVRQTVENNPPQEGGIQLLAWLVRVVKVREVGVNSGLWVARFLSATGLGAGYAWCAAIQTWVNRLVGLPFPDRNSASVLGWRTWAKKTGRLIPVSQAKRGDILGMMHTATTGHLGRKIDGNSSSVRSFEGNTSAGIEGSQRDGDGAFERTRPIGFWDFAIRMS